MSCRQRRPAGAATIALFLLFSALAPPRAGAQVNPVFGKNKVQYKTFSFSYIQSAHFDIYFSDGGLPLAQFAAVSAESAYVRISKLFRYQVVNRIPLIVYNSHNEFQQTNVIGEYLEEGIGGVTELFKNRVVIPYEGDYAKFRHVIHHELVHAVINDMFYGGSIQNILANNITLQLPLWFNEGIAEYSALQWDTNSDMFLRDATVHEYLPRIQQLYGYAAYRGGQSVWWFIANKYGEQKIGEILNRVKSTRSVELGFRGAIGLGVEELSERWQKEQKVLYWPDIAKREDPADYARRLTDRRKDGSFYNTSPAVSPQGDRVAFISNRDEYFALYTMNTLDGGNVTKVRAGQTTPDFEELHLLTPGISWSPDGKRIAVATKAGEEDAIILADLASGSDEKLTFGLDGIFSVDWSPDGRRMAFIGNRLDRSDVYVYDLTTRALTGLTNDMFSDNDPTWSPDGTVIYFSSDRGDLRSDSSVSAATYPHGQMDIYSYRLADSSLTRLTDWEGSGESSVVVSPDGKTIFFVSDRNGINNIYRMDLATGDFRPITNSISGVYQLSLARDGSKLAFSSLVNGGYDLFLLRNPLERDIKMEELERTEFYERREAGPLLAAVPAPDTTGGRPKTDSTGVYGGNVEIDFSNYVFSDPGQENIPPDSMVARLPAITQNVDSNGNYRVNRYRLNFSPDIIYGNAGYDTFYGLTGSTILSFSDLMGDHQIVLSLNLMLDLKNSDFGLQYFYLRDRIDWGFTGYHSARFVIINDIFGGSLYRFRTYGAGVTAYYPLDRFRRLEFGLNWLDVSRENMDVVGYPIQKRTIILPLLGYVHDTSLWGLISPSNGTRYALNLYGTPPIGKDGISFVNITADYRTYLRLGRNYTIALRAAGGGSFGEDPQKFIIGGVDYWINRSFEGGYIPLDNAEDYLFLTTGLPLRGYNYNAAIGSRYTLFNMEFRYPLFALVQAGPIPIGLQSLGGVFFFDAGAAWTTDRDLVLFQKTADGRVMTRDLLMGMGTGARIYVLGFLLRFDVAWAWYWSGFSEPKFYFSLGLDY
jgi:Tol biopolymer transport system component